MSGLITCLKPRVMVAISPIRVFVDDVHEHSAVRELKAAGRMQTGRPGQVKRFHAIVGRQLCSGLSR